MNEDVGRWSTIWLAGHDVSTNTASYRWAIRELLRKPVMDRHRRDVDWFKEQMLTYSSFLLLQKFYLNGWLTIDGQRVVTNRSHYDNDSRHYGQGL